MKMPPFFNQRDEFREADFVLSEALLCHVVVEKSLMYCREKFGLNSFIASFDTKVTFNSTNFKTDGYGRAASSKSPN